MRFRPMVLVWAILALAVAAAAAATIRPEFFAARYVLVFPAVQVVALRGWEAITLAVAALFFLIVGIIRRKVLGYGRIALTLSAFLAMCAALHGATMINRGVSTQARLSEDYGISEGAPGDSSLTLMQYNIQGGKVSPQALADRIESNGVDVVTLTEAPTAQGKKLVEELAKRGLRFSLFDSGTSRYDAAWGSTVVLVSAGMGEYRQIDLPAVLGDAGVPAVSLESVGRDLPSIIAVHPVSPSKWSETNASEWKTQVSAVYGLCAERSNTIIAGDMNSTADHQAAVEKLNGIESSSCRDAMAQAGAGAVGTWPATVPTLLGAPIDRVFAPEGYRGDQAAVVSDGSTDHRGIIVRLVREDG